MGKREAIAHAESCSDPPRSTAYGGRKWWVLQDSNLQPTGYEPAALTIELRTHPSRRMPQGVGAGNLGIGASLVFGKFYGSSDGHLEPVAKHS